MKRFVKRIPQKKQFENRNNTYENKTIIALRAKKMQQKTLSERLNCKYSK